MRDGQAAEATKLNAQPGRSSFIKSAYEPRPCRYPADQLVWLLGRDGSVGCAEMINVSRDGFGLRVSPAPNSGERVILRGGAGDIPAEIRWSAGDRAGGVFLRPDDDH